MQNGVTWRLFFTVCISGSSLLLTFLHSSAFVGLRQTVFGKLSEFQSSSKFSLEDRPPIPRMLKVYAKCFYLALAFNVCSWLLWGDNIPEDHLSQKITNPPSS